MRMDFTFSFKKPKHNRLFASLALMCIFSASMSGSLSAQSLQGFHSSTDSVIVSTTNTVVDWGRGFRFEPKVNLYVYHIGKRVPANGTYAWVIWDYTTQQKVFQQNSVVNNAGNYVYEKCDSVVMLKAGRQYILELYGIGS